ncbi:MAG: hypothetical protein M3Y22_14475 [Pseudomonadota bacterium]|nr:hypothetical protein [Pseudomonadota bacterium]
MSPQQYLNDILAFANRRDARVSNLTTAAFALMRLQDEPDCKCVQHEMLFDFVCLTEHDYLAVLNEAMDVDGETMGYARFIAGLGSLGSPIAAAVVAATVYRDLLKQGETKLARDVLAATASAARWEVGARYER